MKDERLDAVEIGQDAEEFCPIQIIGDADFDSYADGDGVNWSVTDSPELYKSIGMQPSPRVKIFTPTTQDDRATWRKLNSTNPE